MIAQRGGAWQGESHLMCVRVKSDLTKARKCYIHAWETTVAGGC